MFLFKYIYSNNHDLSLNTIFLSEMPGSQFKSMHPAGQQIQTLGNKPHCQIKSISQDEKKGVFCIPQIRPLFFCTMCFKDGTHASRSFTPFIVRHTCKKKKKLTCEMPATRRQGSILAPASIFFPLCLHYTT